LHRLLQHYTLTLNASHWKPRKHCRNIPPTGN